MRKRHRQYRGVSLGTVITLTLTALVLVGCIFVLPKLAGNIELRVDAAHVGVAIQEALRAPREQSTADVQPTLVPDAPPVVALSTLVPTATQAAIHTVTLTATGAISVDLTVQKSCLSEAGYYFEPLFSGLAEKFQGDLNLATLENLAIVNEKLTDVNMPTDALTAIRSSGVNVLCTGFQGALNSGVDGLAATLNAIGQSGITAYGAFTSAESRKHVTTVNVGGTTVALLSFQGELSAAGKRKTSKEEQAFVIAPLTLPTISADITAARAAGAQIVVVSLCWGKTGASSPTNTQRELAQGIADAGADVILGTHSGTLQPVTVLTAKRADGTTHQTLCAYSLGNLLQSDRGDRAAISGALLHVALRYNISDDQLSFESLTYTPTYVWRGKIDGKTSYRVLCSNAAPPDFVDADQAKSMERSLATVRDVFAGSPVSEEQ